MVSSKTQPNNHPIYSVNTDIDSSIFYNDLIFEKEEPTIIMTVKDKVARREKECPDPRNHAENKMWNMIFDRVVSKEGVGGRCMYKSSQGGHKTLLIQTHLRLYK
jgi:hypothetical protein